MSLRIGLIAGCPYPVPQGSQAFIRENALALKKRGHSVHLIVYGYGLGTPVNDFPIHRCTNLPGANKTQAGPSLKKIGLDLLMVKTLREVWKKEQLQVVFAHNYEGLAITILSGLKPIIYHAHNAMSDELPYYFTRGKAIMAKFGQWLDRYLPSRADLVVVPHERLAGHLVLKGCPKNKIRVIPPPIDLSQFPISKVQPNTMPPIVYTGNLDQYQNLEFLFRVIRRVREQIPETRFIIGTAEKVSFPDAEVVQIGTFDSLNKLLEQDSIMAIPRISWSGYPIKLLNAMASAKPVVCCSSSAYPITDKVNGLIVPDNDEQAFAEALLLLMKTPKLRAELGKSARETVKQHNNPERIGQMLEELAYTCIKG